MYTIKLTPAFEAWMGGIKDNVTRLRLARRLDKAQRGNLGDIIAPVNKQINNLR